MEGTNITIEWTEKIIVRELDYVFKVMKLLRDTPIKVLSKLYMSLFKRLLLTIFHELLQFNMFTMKIKAEMDNVFFKEISFNLYFRLF